MSNYDTDGDWTSDDSSVSPSARSYRSTPHGPNPFVDNLAFNKKTSTYEAFKTESDAMLASLLLFHQAPSYIMDSVIAIVTHPEFDSNQVTFRDSKDVLLDEEESRRKKGIIAQGVRAHRRSLDVIRTAEKHRMKERMVVVHARSQSRSQTRLNWAGFPLFVLDEVLDIIKADRLAKIDTSFEKPLREDGLGADEVELEEDILLSNMSLVHRSWTFPVQKALGQVVWINPSMGDLPYHRRAVEGPWTSVVAITVRDPKPRNNPESDCIAYPYDYDSCDSYAEPSSCRHKKQRSKDRKYQRVEVRKEQRHENDWRMYADFLHCFLLSIPLENLKRIYVRGYEHNYGRIYESFASRLNDTIKEMVQQTTQLEELTLYMPIRLDFPTHNESLLANLKTLRLQEYTLARAIGVDNAPDTLFPSLRSLSLFDIDGNLLSVLSIQRTPLLESMFISGYLPYASDVQCGTIFEHIRTLRIGEGADEWFKKIGPHCSNLEHLSVQLARYTVSDFLESLPTTIRSLELCYSEHYTWWLLKDRLDSLIAFPFSEQLPLMKSLTLQSSIEVDEGMDELLELTQRMSDKYHGKMKVVLMNKGIPYNFYTKSSNGL